MPTLTVRPRADLDAALADAAERAGAAVADVRVVGLEDVSWPDASLGCPQPGKAYAQAVVDGQRLTLEVGGRQFVYHQGGEQPFAYCAAPAPPPSG